MADDGFIFVSRKKAKKTKETQDNVTKYSLKTDSFILKKENELESISELNLLNWERQLQHCRSNLLCSEVWQSFKGHLSLIARRFQSIPSKNPVLIDVVCYGIGNFLSDPIARHQMSLLALMIGNFELCDKCYIYDPVLTPGEQYFVSSAKDMILIEENEECKRCISKPTIFFMPHCGKTMYNNVLSANWGISLKNVVLFGNSFKGYHERLISSILKEEAICMYKIIDNTEEFHLECEDLYFDTFNDLSFHCFNQLEVLPDDFWNCNTASNLQKYHEEIILREREMNDV